MNVADYIAEPMMNGQSVKREWVDAIRETLGTNHVKFEVEPSHDVCDLTGDETTCYLCIPDD